MGSEVVAACADNKVVGSPLLHVRSWKELQMLLVRALLRDAAVRVARLSPLVSELLRCVRI